MQFEANNKLLLLYAAKREKFHMLYTMGKASICGLLMEEGSNSNLLLAYMLRIIKRIKKILTAEKKILNSEKNNIYTTSTPRYFSHRQQCINSREPNNVFLHSSTFKRPLVCTYMVATKHGQLQ